jgi:two-component system sensor histidine kinase VicK
MEARTGSKDQRADARMSEQDSSPTKDSDGINRKLDDRNRRYLNQLQRSGDPGDMRSKVISAMFDYIADGLIVFDEKLTIVLANHAAAQLARWDLEDVSRDELRRQYSFFKADATSPLPIDEEPIVVATREKRSCELEGYVTGSTLPESGVFVRAHAAPILDDNDTVIGGVTVFHDITERLRLQRQRDTLVALIAHDIKNHLGSVGSFLALLTELLPDNIDAEMVAFIAGLKRDSARFLEIANTFLEMSRERFFAEQAHHHRIDLLAVLKEVVGLNEFAASAKGVRLSLSIACQNPKVNGIPAVVRQIFHNLLQNAVEACSNGASVEIHVSMERPEYVTVKVTDTGSGMTPEQVSDLFDPDRVVRHVPRTTHSTGFGLYLSAMLIEQMGGTISCTSEIAQGTTVMVVLPA